MCVFPLTEEELPFLTSVRLSFTEKSINMFICPSPFINLRYTAIVENCNIRRRKKINSNQFENKALVLCPGVVVLRLVLFFCLL